jgi:type I restriction enzyme S subunit
LVSAAVTGKIEVRSTVDRSRLRFLVGANITEAIAHKPNAGRTKFHKFVYLTEAHARVHELAGNYLREAAGPLDRAMLKEMEAALEQAGHTVARQVAGRGSQVTYEVIGQRGSAREELGAILGSRMAAFDRLLAELGDENTRSVEAVATLYAAWNDALLDGGNPNDDEIVFEVLHNWHPQKGKKFTATELRTWLGWMRRRDLVPRGTGPKTMTGRLFP